MKGWIMPAPQLLLHICCAPDEAWVVHTLNADYRLRCFFCNPNIQPADEYEKRLAEARRTAGHFEVPFSAADYAPAEWESAVAPYGHTPEGGERCEHCFTLRLRETARFCKQLGWPRFTTVMSVSPHKKIDMLNRVGEKTAGESGVEYVPFDFKKKNGFLGSIALSRELGIYRQDYCGCRLSRAERDERVRRKTSQQQPAGSSGR